jgi:hypothetical protein
MQKREDSLQGLSIARSVVWTKSHILNKQAMGVVTVAPK